MKNKKAFLYSLITIAIVTTILIILLILYKNDLLKQKELIDSWKENGMTLISYRDPSIFFVYLDLMKNSILSILMFLPPFVVLFPALYAIFKTIKSGYARYIVNFRSEYNTFIKKQIINSYKYALIIPIIYLIIMLGCGILTGFSLNLSLDGLDSNIFNISFGSPVILIVVTFVNLLLADIFYINIGLLVMTKTKNLLLNNVLSYLVVIVISIIFELFIGYGLAIITHNYIFANVSNLYNLWYPGDCGNILYVTLYLFLISLFTTLAVFKVYKNKEKVVANV